MISIQELVRLKGRQCHYCREDFAPNLSDATRDHVVAIINGGSNAIDNLVPACEWCNSDKSDMGYDEFLMKLPDFLAVRSERKAKREAKRRKSMEAQRASVNRKLRQRALQDPTELKDSLTVPTLAERREAFERDQQVVANIAAAERARRAKRKRPKTAEPKPIRWAAEMFPTDDAFVHRSSLSCPCTPQVTKIRGGHRILEHRKMTAGVTAES